MEARADRQWRIVYNNWQGFVERLRKLGARARTRSAYLYRPPKIANPNAIRRQD